MASRAVVKVFRIFISRHIGKGEAMNKNMRLLTILTAAALMAAACGSTSSATSSATTQGASSSSVGPATTINVGYVPTLDTVALYLAQTQGYFKAEGLKVVLHANDSGPALVTSTLQGSYQFSYVAAQPLLIAFSKGATVRVVVGSSVNGPNSLATGVFVKAGSAITSISDLAGKSVAVNALTSPETLAVQTVVSSGGGNPSTIHFVALPVTQELQAVSRGQVAAADVFEPFVATALADGLKDLGDPQLQAFPKGSPIALYFSSNAEATNHPAVVRQFAAAMTKAEAFADAHPSQYRQAMVTFLGTPAALAAKVPLVHLTPTIDPTATSNLVALMRKSGYLSTTPNLKAFLP